MFLVVVIFKVLIFRPQCLYLLFRSRYNALKNNDKNTKSIYMYMCVCVESLCFGFSVLQCSIDRSRAWYVLS